MNPRRQTAGTMGIVSGIAYLIIILLFFTTDATMDTFNDPATALPFLRENAARVRVISYMAIITVAAATLYVAGLASALHARTPTRATGTLYFGLGGLAGAAVGAFIALTAYPWLVSTAAKDQVLAQHAYAAVNGFTLATDGISNFFLGLSILLAGWAITATPGFGKALGWFAVVAGVVTAMAGLAPQVDVIYLGAFILPIIWLIWGGYALRKTGSA